MGGEAVGQGVVIGIPLLRFGMRVEVGEDATRALVEVTVVWNAGTSACTFDTSNTIECALSPRSVGPISGAAAAIVSDATWTRSGCATPAASASQP